MGVPKEYHLYSAEAGVDILVISWDALAAGAVGALDPLTRKKGFAATPVVLISTGTYDIFLKDKYIDLLWYVANCNGPVSATTGKIGHLVSDSPNAAAPKVRITFTRQDTGVAADPQTGDQIYVTLAMKRGQPK